MMKRIIGSIIAFASIISVMSMSAFAITVDDVTNTQKEYTAYELNAIEAEREELYAIVRAQLAAQDAEDSFEVFKPVVDEVINAKYFSNIANGATTVDAPNGGVVEKESNRLKITYAYYNEITTERLYDIRNNIDASDVIIEVILDKYLDTLGGWGSVMSLILDTMSVLEEKNWDNIMAGTRCMYSVVSKDKVEDATVCFNTEWVNKYDMDISDNNGLYDTVTYKVF